jgi:hypothetical protein
MCAAPALAAWRQDISDPALFTFAAPIVVVASLLVRRGSERWHISVRDRAVDISLGLPVLALAVAAMVVLHLRVGPLYGALRLDVLLAAPIAAGMLLIWGTEQAWAFRREIAVLAVAWPWPYAVAAGTPVAELDRHLRSGSSALAQVLDAGGDVGQLAVPSALAVGVTCGIVAWLALPLRLWRRGVEALLFAVVGVTIASVGSAFGLVSASESRVAGRAIAIGAAAGAVGLVPLLAARSARLTPSGSSDDSVPARRPLGILGFAALTATAVAAIALGIAQPASGSLTDAYGRAGISALDERAPLEGWASLEVPAGCAVRAAAEAGDRVVGRRIIRTTTVSLDPGSADYRNCREALAPFVPAEETSHQDVRAGVVLETQRGPSFAGVRTAALVSWVWPVLDGSSTRYERVVIAGYADEPTALSDGELDQLVDHLQRVAGEQIAGRAGGVADEG